MSLASESWAVIVTVPPATGLKEDEDTRYLVAAPGTVVMVEVVPVRLLPSVPVTVVAVPDAVWLVNTTVATPLEFVVEVGEVKLPLASDFDQVTN